MIDFLKNIEKLKCHFQYPFCSRQHRTDHSCCLQRQLHGGQYRSDWSYSIFMGMRDHEKEAEQTRRRGDAVGLCSLFCLFDSVSE